MEDEGLVEPIDENEALLPESMEVVQGDNVVMWVGGVLESMEGQVPVRVEIDVDQESQSALLVSAHFGMSLANWIDLTVFSTAKQQIILEGLS